MILNFVLVTGFVVALALAFVSFNQENKNTKKYLTLVFIILAFEIFYFYAELHENRSLKILGFALSEGFGPFIGILIWLYVQAAINHPVKKKWIIYALIYPVLHLIIIVIPISVCFIARNWIWVGYKTIVEYYDFLILPENTITIFVFFLSFLSLKKYQSRIKNHFSDVSYISYNWVKKITMVGIIILMVDMSTTVYEGLFGKFSWNVGYLIIIAVCVLLFFLAYYGIKQRQIVVPEALTLDSDFKEDKHLLGKRIYLKKFSDIEVTDLKERVINLMTEQKLFCKPNLVLTDIATLLDLTDKQTTELINLELNTNFHDFVNAYRVEEVKRIITSGKLNHLTLLAIGLEAGFQSKTSFNRVFKKIAGVSPSEYKKALETS